MYDSRTDKARGYGMTNHAWRTRDGDPAGRPHPPAHTAIAEGLSELEQERLAAALTLPTTERNPQ